MKLDISSGSSQFEIEVTGPPGSRRVWVGGREMPCDWVPLADGRYSLILNGRVYDLSLYLDTDTCSVAGRRGSHQFEIIDPRRLSKPRHAEEVRSGLQRISAEMPGKVIRVLVKEGETVRCDQSLLVLEAMKMQNEIRSPKSGTVKKVAVQDGRAVGAGEFLLSIE